MGDKDDFKLDNVEEKEDRAGTGAPENSAAPSENPAAADASAPTAPPQKSRGSRLLLLALLLVVLVAAGYFYLGGGMIAPSSQPEPQAETEPKAMPVPQRDQTKPEEKEARTSVVRAQQSEKPHAQPVPPRPTAQKEAAEKADPQDNSATNKPAKTEIAKSEKVDIGQKAAPGVAFAAPVVQESPPKEAAATNVEMATDKGPALTKKANEPVKTPTVQTPAGNPKGRYTLQAGAFVIIPNLVTAQEKIRRLGYEPRVTKAIKKTEVTRLRVGTFFPNQGEAKVADLKAIGAEPFFIIDGDLMVVYAGTFYRGSQARRFAEHLAEKGIHVEEEKVPAKLPLSILRFGDFASREEARAAAEKAEAADLDILLVKRS